MARHACTRCGGFDSDERDPRCPKCLRKSTVKAAARAAAGPPTPTPPERTTVLKFLARCLLGSAVWSAVMAASNTMWSRLLTSPALWVYAIALGGVVFAIAWTLFPSTRRLGGI